jgi:hypothetical protein
MIGTIDFHYKTRKLIARGHFDWAHLNDSEEITQFNKSMPNASPSPKMAVASDAIAAGIELGYDIFNHVPKMRQDHQKLYLFGRYEYYDSMAKVEKNVLDYGWCGKQRMALGLNYYPLKEVVVKAEYSKRFYKKQYNDEPTVSLGIAYAGFFTK